jgi:CelD/BcsL family acetyltransferase involved in cellulose biosynthesis
LQLVLHHEIPLDEKLREQWNALVLASEFPQVFHTYEWALAVYRAYSVNLVPYLWLAYEGESLVGIASLAKDAYTGKICFLAGTTADYCDFISVIKNREQLVKLVIGELNKMHLPPLSLANLPAQSASFEPLKESAKKCGMTFFMRPAFKCAQVTLHTSEQRTELKRSVKSKEMFRRKMKLLQKLGPVVCEHLRSPENVLTALPQFFNAQIGRSLQMGRISNLAMPERQTFLQQLAIHLSQQGSLVLSRLVTDGKTAAWNYGFQFAGSWFWYQPAMNGDLQQYSPGFCLLSRIIEEACDQPGLNCVDLGLGAEEYKGRFVTNFQKTLDVSIQHSKVNCYREMSRYYLASSMRGAPTLDRWVRSSVRERLGRLRKDYKTGGVVDLLRRGKKLTKRKLFGRTEVLFFEYGGGLSAIYPGEKKIHLEPLALEHLARAATEYFNDSETLSYLIRAAKRLEKKECEGITVINARGVPVQFCWVGKFEGFYMHELELELIASAERCLLFDCWTPSIVRRQGFYTAAISNIAQTLAGSGRNVWVFCDARNNASKRGIERAGFVQRFALSRREYFGVGRITRAEAETKATGRAAILVA